ncbi:MAG: competence/damage-inducible protein A [Bacteroidetes bacterium]|nr:competence/damage-inducible protein A [Bacteroidota bacterium]
MKAEIITIGDELLIGQVVDTNSAWMGQQLNLAGIEVKQITSIADKAADIIAALDGAVKHADIILITGGLGPTKDDLTKQTLCTYFNTQLVFNEDVYKDVEALFKSHGKEVTPLNRKQAEVPANCKPIRNKNGTAPGMCFDADGKLFFSMPGVPYEMKTMIEQDVLPMIKRRFKLPAIFHKTILTQGIGESFLSEIISDWEDGLAWENMKLAYLPSPGKVRLRITAFGMERSELIKKVEKQIDLVKPLINSYIYGYENFGEHQPGIEEIVGEMLRKKKATLATAESCTGGYISHLITNVPGSSDYYVGSVISYSNEVKVQELNIDPVVIEQDGVVSRVVVEQMAVGVRKKLKVDYAIAASGIAGPTGGTNEKPVGTVWIAVATPLLVTAQKFLFGNNRKRNIQKTADAALNMLRKLME